MAIQSRGLDGVLPIVPTIFDDTGTLDETGLRNTVDFLLHGGVHGMVLLANASEGYALAEEERRLVAGWVIDQVRDRVPVVVTCNHPSTLIAARYAKEAEDLGAAGLMFMAPFFGQWTADPNGVRRHFEDLAKATSIPLCVQDHPLSSTDLSAAFLVDLAHRIDRMQYYKVESLNAPVKIGEILRLGTAHIKGLFGGMAGVMFMEELDHGAVGTMPGSAIPAVFVHILRLYRQGDREGAAEMHARYLPLMAFETRIGGLRVAKEVLAMNGVIRSAYMRGPVRGGWDEVTFQSFRRVVDKLGLHRVGRS